MPSGPMVGRMTCFSMKPTVDSTTVWMPLGTARDLYFELAMRNTATESANATKLMKAILLNPRAPEPNQFGHSTMFSMGGNSTAANTAALLLWAPRYAARSIERVDGSVAAAFGLG